MDDFMDNLVKEVEGNIKPIRAERLDESPAPREPAPAVREQPQQPQGSMPAYQEPPRMPEAAPVYQTSAMPLYQPQAPIYQAPQVVPFPVYQGAPAASAAPVFPEPPRAAESAPAQPAAAEAVPEVNKERTEEAEKDLFLHIHRENVKCYRNTQATIIENTNSIKQGLEDRHANVHSWLLALLVLSIVNLGVNALLMLHLIFGFL